MQGDIQKAEKEEFEKLDPAVKVFVEDCRSKLNDGKLMLKGLKSIKNLIGIHLVGDITELTIQDCANFGLDGIEKIGSTLTKLVINNCNIVDLIPIQYMSSIVYLDLASNDIASLEPLELLLDIVDLDLSNNKIPWQELLYLNTLFSIKRLNICGNPCCAHDDIIHCFVYPLLDPETKKVEAEAVWYKTADKSKNDLEEIRWQVPALNNSLSPFPIEMMEAQVKKQQEKLLPYIAKKEQEIKDEAARLEALEKRLADGAQEVQDGVQNVKPNVEANDVQ